MSTESKNSAVGEREAHALKYALRGSRILICVLPLLAATITATSLGAQSEGLELTTLSAPPIALGESLSITVGVKNNGVSAGAWFTTKTTACTVMWDAGGGYCEPFQTTFRVLTIDSDCLPTRPGVYSIKMYGYADPYPFHSKPPWDRYPYTPLVGSPKTLSYKILAATVPFLTVTPENLHFGAISVGDTVDKTFTVKNTGVGTLFGEATASEPFSIVSGGTYSLAAGKSQTVTVRYSPVYASWFDMSDVLFTGGNSVTRSVRGSAYTPPVISDPGPQEAQVGVPFNLSLVIESDGSSRPSLTVTGLPSGLKYNAAQNAIVGVPLAAVTDKVVTVNGRTEAGRSVEPMTFHLSVVALPTWAYGTFNGYVPIQGGVGMGAASMTVTAQGKTTGKLSIGGSNYTFSANSYAEGSDPDNGLVIVAQAKVGRTLLPLEMTVQRRLFPDDTGSLPQNLGVVHGTLDANGKGVQVAMYRNVWIDVGFSAMATNFTGYYTATLPGDGSFGSGYLALTLDNNKNVKVAGKLADGTAVSLAGTLILDADGRVFAVVYAAPATYKGGCLYGLVEFVDPAAGEVYLRSLDDMPFTWSSRSPQATGTYGDGFDREPCLTGGWYDKIGNLYGYYQNTNLTVGVDADAPTPELTVGSIRYDALCWDPSGIILTPTLKAGVMAGLSAPPAGKPVDPDKDGIWDYGATNSVGLKCTLTRATGVFKGSFLAWFDYPLKKHVSKNLAFEGVLTPVNENPDDGVAGRGFFLWPDKAVPPLPAKPYAFKWSYDFKILME